MGNTAEVWVIGTVQPSNQCFRPVQSSSSGEFTPGHNLTNIFGAFAINPWILSAISLFLIASRRVVSIALLAFLFEFFSLQLPTAMVDRASKRLRRISSESDDFTGGVEDKHGASSSKSHLNRYAFNGEGEGVADGNYHE